MFSDIYRNKKVIITGNTGFKGSWLSTWLMQCGAKVYGYSIDIPTHPSMYEELNLEQKIEEQIFADIRDKDSFAEFVNRIKPDFIFFHGLISSSIFLVFSSNSLVVYSTS